MKINEANQYIIDSLKAYCEDMIPERVFEVKAPFLLFVDKPEFEELSKSTSHFNFEVSTIRFNVINIGSIYYLIVAGEGNLTSENIDLVEVEIDNSIFLGCAATLKLKVPSYVNPYQIIDEICVQIDENYNGYSIETVCQFFEPIKAYIIPEGIALSNELLLATIGKLIISNSQLKKLPYSKRTVNSYIDFFDNGFFDNNIINSFLSYSWRYAFLDVYRCLEPIFKHLILPDLKDALGIEISIDEIGNLLDKYCGWRPQEIGSMQKLFDDENGYISEDLRSQFKKLSIGDNPNEKVGKSVYQLRNRIVHHQNQYHQIETLLTPEKWDELIGCILDAITELRKKFPY